MQPNNQKNVSNSKEPSEFSLSKGDIAHFNPIHRVIIPIKSTIIIKKGFATLDYFKNSKSSFKKTNSIRDEIKLQRHPALRYNATEF